VLLQKGGTDKIKLSVSARNDEEKEAFLFQQYQRFEQYVYYWFLGKLVFKDHHNCLDNHKDYVLNNNVKPKLMSIIAYLSHVNYMYEIIPYLQAPFHEGEMTRKADCMVLSSPRLMQSYFAELSIVMDWPGSFKINLKTTG
jgi:hypothetical protein